MADSVQSYNVSVFQLVAVPCLKVPPLPLPSVVVQDEDSERFKTIVVFDCRGVEPFDFSPRVCGMWLHSMQTRAVGRSGQCIWAQ